MVVPVVIGPFGTMSRYTFAHRRTMAKRMYFRAVDAPNLRRAAAIHFTTTAEREEARWHGIDFGDRAHVVPPPYCRRRPSCGGLTPATGVPPCSFSDACTRSRAWTFCSTRGPRFVRGVRTRDW